MRRVLRSGATSLITLCLILSAIWANLAITYQLLGPAGVRIGAYLALDVIALAALLALVLRRRWRAVLICGAAYAIFLAWSSSISASNDKNWAADVAHGFTGIVDGDLLATFATSAGAPKRITPRVGNSEHTIFQSCDRSIFFLFIGWDRLLPTRL